jgi:3-hydroxymyristoyl/3-hydroxydecanoyl-(acyl carrier protein) dehydratase
MASEYDEFVNLFTLPIQSDPEITLYSAADYGPIPLESQAIAHSIARALCKPLNFPELINRVYQDGARIFIEPGPGATCSRWIHETLKDKPHITVSMNQRGVDDHPAILKALAKLLSHRVPLNLSPLYSQTSSSSGSGNAIIKTVTLGGSRIKDTILSKMSKMSLDPSGVKKENKQRFKGWTSPANSVSWNVPDGGKQPQFATSLLYEYPGYPTPPSGGPGGVTAQTHITFLKTRLDALQQLSQIIQLQISVSRQLLNRQQDPGQGPPPPLAPIPQIPHTSLWGAGGGGAHGVQVYRQPPSRTDTPPERTQERTGGTGSDVRRPDVIFDEADILEFANGKIANVFGQEYALIDTYPRRVRLPGPPYLFVSRVTRLEAERGRYERCSIETEYDIPHDAWYTIDGQIPGTVAIEASHANMLLVSYLGIDFENQGQRVYRALDGHITFLDKLPQAGDTLRCNVTIDSFARSGDTQIFFYTYECFVRDRILLKMKGIAGFFTDEALEKAKGISPTFAPPSGGSGGAGAQAKYFESPLTCHKLAFDEVDLTRLSEGDIAACFGQQYQQNGRNRSLRLPPSAVRMIDRVTSVDPRGGARGLGLVYGEKTLDPGAWYFNCHFKDDLCIPGTLVGEGCVQLLQFYLLFLGLQTHTTDARFQPKPDLKLAGHSRGQIRPTSGVLTYRLEVTDIGLFPQPYATANVDVIFVEDVEDVSGPLRGAGKVVARCKNLGMQLSEK